MIPPSIISGVAYLSASVEAATPVAQATPITKAALVSYGQTLVGYVDTALMQAVGDLDAPDPSGFAGDLVAELNYLAMSVYDQASLSDMRGTLGRRVFNLAQIASVDAARVRSAAAAALSGSIGGLGIGVGAIGTST